MRVNSFSSITAKLFYLVVLTVLGTVVGLTYKNSEDLRQLLQAQLKDRALNDSSISGRAIEGKLSNWESQLSVILQATLQTSDKLVRQQQLESFLTTRPDFIAIHIFQMNPTEESFELSFAFTGNEKSRRFGNQKADKIRSIIRRFNGKYHKRHLQMENHRYVESLAYKKLTNLPIINIGKTFKVKDEKSNYLVVLTAWQDPLLESLVESNVINNFVVDLDGRVVSSRDGKEMRYRKNFKNYGLVMKALAEKQPQGFSDRYRGAGSSQEWLGAYFRIPRYDLVVIAQQDRKVAYSDIDESVLSAFKWGGLFLALAVLVSYLGAEGVTKKMRMVTAATQRIAAGDFNTRLGLRSQDEVGVLSASVDAMANRIQFLLQAQVRQAERDRDLETARAVQETLFPKKTRHQDVLVVSGFSIPASETGGDWWGHYSTGDGVEYVFVADAMGHGVPAALVTAVAYSSCMTLAHMLAEANQIYSPGEILERVNRVLYEAVEGTISMTFFCLMVDYHEGKITFANAGHNFPVLIPADPDDDRIKRKSRTLKSISDRYPLSLRVSGTILGVEKDVSFKEKSLELRPGDKFFLFTDGLVECKSPSGGMWGRKVMLEKVMARCDLPPEELVESIKVDAFGFFQNVPREDDLTIVAAEFPTDAKIGGYRKRDAILVDANFKGWLAGGGQAGPKVEDAIAGSETGNGRLKPGYILDLNDDGLMSAVESVGKKLAEGDAATVESNLVDEVPVAADEVMPLEMANPVASESEENPLVLRFDGEESDLANSSTADSNSGKGGALSRLADDDELIEEDEADLAVNSTKPASNDF